MNRVYVAGLLASALFLGGLIAQNGPESVLRGTKTFCEPY